MTTEVATYSPPEGGWASDGNEDLPVARPTIALVPPISATKEFLAGEFKHSDRNHSEPSLDVVILYRKETRALFAADSKEPVCRSDDGKFPAKDMPLWDMEEIDLGKRGKVAVFGFPGQCGVCPFGEWEGTTPPACGNSYVLLVDRGDGDLAQLRVKGTSIKPYRDFIAKKPARMPIYAYRTTVTSEFKERGLNKWYEMRFRAEPLEEDEARRYDALLRSQAHRFEPALEEPEPSGFMDEVSELMRAHLLKAGNVADFMGTAFNETNIRTFMGANGYEDVESFIAAVQRETVFE